MSDEKPMSHKEFTKWIGGQMDKINEKQMSRYSFYELGGKIKNRRDEIAARAKRDGCSYLDLLAAGAENDPFYIGSDTQIEQALWFANAYRQCDRKKPLHLRKLHYWLISPGQKRRLPAPIKYKGKTYNHYVNNDACWGKLSTWSKFARYFGLISFDEIVDRRNPEPVIVVDYLDIKPYAHIDGAKITLPRINVGGFSEMEDVAQPYHLELWIEKSTMIDELLPICKRYHTNYVSFEGQASITSVIDGLFQRIKASGYKPTRIFYVSDFDFAGASMPATVSNKIQWVNEFEIGKRTDIKLRPIALTREQVKKYNLPHDPQRPKREYKFNDWAAGAVELDALDTLHPGVLEKIVKVNLSKYYSREAKKAVQEAKGASLHAMTEKLEGVKERFSEELEALEQANESFEELNRELIAIDADISEFKVDTFPPHVDESDDWLLDTNRDYYTQNAYYQKYKNHGKIGGD